MVCEVSGSTAASFDPFDPPRDPVFTYLYSRVVEWFLPLYHAEIPLNLVRPFCETHEPHKTPIGRKALNGMIREYKEGKFTPDLWLYPYCGQFVMSDDYLCYFMALELGLRSLPCEIMGYPTHKEVTAIQGPAPEEYVRRLPGGSDYDPQKTPPKVIKEMPGD